MDPTSLQTAPLAALRTPPSTPKRIKHPDVTRDQRLEIYALSKHAGWTPRRIAKKLNITLHQVYYSFHHQFTPQKQRSGRKSIINTPHRARLVEFVTSSKRTRRMRFIDVAFELGWDVSESAIRRALAKEGYHRRVARKKPPISETNRLLRLAWAIEHENWTQEQWNTILWTDETWVTSGKHTKVWVTRRAGEEYDPDCIEEREPRKNGWMFWGCFSGGLGKGPCLFWEKDWGTITSETYRAHTVPLIHGWTTLHPELQLMQDGASGHAARLTIEDLQERGIQMVTWPPFSPDLNPIETVWDWMKDWIDVQYQGAKLNYDQLRRAVRDAWDAVPADFLSQLIDDMPKRCKAVIRADGKHTPY